MPAVDKKAESSSQNFVAGAVAGCAMRTILFPIDTIKTNMQRSGTGLIAAVRSFLAAAWRANERELECTPGVAKASGLTGGASGDAGP